MAASLNWTQPKSDRWICTLETAAGTLRAVVFRHPSGRRYDYGVRWAESPMQAMAVGSGSNLERVQQAALEDMVAVANSVAVVSNN